MGGRALSSLLGAAMLAVAIGAGLQTLVDGAAWSAVCAAASCMAFVVVATATGGVPAEITQALRGRLHRRV